MQNKFCKSLSNAVSFRIPGDSNSLTFNPCCLYDQYLPFHPVVFKKHRQDFITSDSEYLKNCSKCKLKEKTHGYDRTQRSNFNKQIPDGIGDDIYKLEIVLDTTCNAACIQCGPYQSSLWRNEQQKNDKNYKHLQPKSQIDSKIDLIKENIDIQKVKMWHFWGGEPLITDTHLKFIEDIDDLSDVTLDYTTNGSIFPDEYTLELWSKCKEVKIHLSTDGTGQRFDYCRWPLKWDKWAKIALRFKNETPSNMRFHINYCAMPFNAIYTLEIQEWIDVNFKTAQNGNPVKINIIRSEGTIDLACTPMSLREDVWKQLGQENSVSRLLHELPIKEPTHMLEHLTYWDPIRKLDWRNTFPAAAKHFK